MAEGCHPKKPHPKPWVIISFGDCTTMKRNPQAELANIEKLMSTAKAKSFLGKEFLTWLWFCSEEDSRYFDILSIDQERYQVQVWVDDRIVLESANSKAHQQTLKGGDPSQSLEAAASLRSGKSIKEIRLGFHVEEIGDFICTFSGDDLNPRSVRLPEPIEEYTQSENFSQLGFRLKCCQVLVDTIDGLFKEFLEERVHDDWQTKGLQKIKAWIRERTSQIDSYLH